MNIEEAIERFIVDEIMIGGADTRIEPDQSLLDSGILDSLALLRLIAFIQEQFGVDVDGGEVTSDNFDTLNDIRAFIEQRRKTS